MYHVFTALCKTINGINLTSLLLTTGSLESIVYCYILEIFIHICTNVAAFDTHCPHRGNDDNGLLKLMDLLKQIPKLASCKAIFCFQGLPRLCGHPGYCINVRLGHNSLHMKITTASLISSSEFYLLSFSFSLLRFHFTPQCP